MPKKGYREKTGVWGLRIAGRLQKKKSQPVTQELNKVSPLITRAWTGPRQEKP